MILPSLLNLHNQCLIAMPSIEDSCFFQSITYIFEHTHEGAMGLICNRPAPFTVRDFFMHLNIPFDSFPQLQDPVYVGGPVQRDKGFILHHEAGYFSSSLQISEGIYITTSKDILMAIGENRGPKHFLIILGYAGWSAGQLEKEILENAWLSAPANPSLLFHTPCGNQWQAAAKSVGVDIKMMPSMAGHA